MPKEPQHLMIFPVLIQMSEIEGVETLNEKLCKSIYELKEKEPNSKPDTWACDVYTTIMSGKMLLDTPPFDALTEIILAEVTTYARALKLDIDRYPPRINECWVNVYGSGNAQDIHNHPTASSAVSTIRRRRKAVETSCSILRWPIKCWSRRPPNGLWSTRFFTQ